MPRAKRICPKPGCPNVVARRYCADHDREYEATRGTSTQRGYGSRHQSMRAKVKPAVDAGLVDCWRCGQRIQAGEAWDLGHDDADRSVYRGPEHANQCNRSAAGRKAHTVD